jgi:Fe-S oxidoreductase
MLRHRTAEARKKPIPFTDREITKTDRNGELAKHVAPLANWATSTGNKLTRPLMEAVLDVHHAAALPAYASETFVHRAKKDELTVNSTAPAYGKRKAVMYATCSINYNDPDLGMIARKLLAKNGVETEVVYPGCCGMPQLEQGNLDEVAANAKKVSAALSSYIDRGYDVIALVPSCALMLKLEWPLLVPEGDPAYTNIAKLAQATFDLTEYIVDLAGREGLMPAEQPLAGNVALHIACHARAQNMGAKAEQMLKLLPGSDKISLLERCSGHGGSWGVKKENFEVALKVGKPVARRAAEVMKSAEEKQEQAFIASECPLAALHIVQGVERLGEAAPKTASRPWNPVEIFALSYGIKREAA